MKKVDIKKIELTPVNILFASTSDPDYEMNKVILAEIDGRYIILEGNHCSCYGFEDIEFSAISYTETEIKRLPLDYGIDVELKAFIKRYI